MTVRSRFTSFDWQDVCERCRMVVEMPLDGTAAKHLCLADRVPWEDLLLEDADLEEIHTLELHRGVRQNASVASIENIDADAPSQMGPFAPGTPPRPRLVGDLLLWSRANLIELMIRRKTVKVIEDWLLEYGLSLASRSPRLLQSFLRTQFAARYEALPPPRETLGGYTPEDFNGGTGVQVLRYALDFLDGRYLGAALALVTNAIYGKTAQSLGSPRPQAMSDAQLREAIQPRMLSDDRLRETPWTLPSRPVGGSKP